MNPQFDFYQPHKVSKIKIKRKHGLPGKCLYTSRLIQKTLSGDRAARDSETETRSGGLSMGQEGFFPVWTGRPYTLPDSENPNMSSSSVSFCMLRLNYLDHSMFLNNSIPWQSPSYNLASVHGSHSHCSKLFYYICFLDAVTLYNFAQLIPHFLNLQMLFWIYSHCHRHSCCCCCCTLPIREGT